jgi:addiction module HigA family antidote
MSTEQKRPPTHPGEILRLDFLEPLDLSQRELARRLHVDPRTVNDLVHGRRGVTAHVAIRLATLFGKSAAFWLHLQKRYELDVAEDEADAVRAEVTPLSAG